MQTEIRARIEMSDKRICLLGLLILIVVTILNFKFFDRDELLKYCPFYNNVYIFEIKYVEKLRSDGKKTVYAYEF